MNPNQKKIAGINISKSSFDATLINMQQTKLFYQDFSMAKV